MHVITKTRPVSAWLFMFCGVWLVGLSLYFSFLRPPLLPEDLHYMGTSISQVQASVPGLQRWLSKVFTVMGVFIASTGVLTIFMALAAIPARLPGTSWAIALSGVLSVALMSATNFMLHSEFEWLLLAPAIAWLAGPALYVTEHSHSGAQIQRPSATPPD